MQIATQVQFSAAHFLYTDPMSKCYRLHGHNYLVEIDLEGPWKGSKNGMVLDYNHIDYLLKREMDHKLFVPETLLSQDPRKPGQAYVKKLGSRLVIHWGGNDLTIPATDVYLLTGCENSTVEEVAWHICGLLMKEVKHGGEVTVWETPHSYATERWGTRLSKQSQ